MATRGRCILGKKFGVTMAMKETVWRRYPTLRHCRSE